MVFGKARVVRHREVQQSLFDDDLIDHFRGRGQPDAFERRTIPIVYGSGRLADSRDDSGVFCGGEFIEACAISEDAGDTRARGTSRDERSTAVAPQTDRVIRPDLPLAPASVSPSVSTENRAKTVAPRLARVESAIATHPRFEVAPPAERVGSFAWRRFALGLVAGTAAGVLLLAVLGSF